jgi:hypothetical protein
MRWTVSLTVVPVILLSSFTMMGRAIDDMNGVEGAVGFNDGMDVIRDRFRSNAWQVSCEAVTVRLKNKGESSSQNPTLRICGV